MATHGMARTPASSRQRQLAWVAAALAAVAAGIYARQLFWGETFVLRDHLTYTWPERKILSDALRAGRLPEWNDLVGFGTQFAASSANGVTVFVFGKSTTSVTTSCSSPTCTSRPSGN